MEESLRKASLRRQHLGWNLMESVKDLRGQGKAGRCKSPSAPGGRGGQGAKAEGGAGGEGRTQTTSSLKCWATGRKCDMSWKPLEPLKSKQVCDMIRYEYF